MRALALGMGFFLLSFSSGLAEGAWDKLIKEIDQPARGGNVKAPDKSEGSSVELAMPDMDANTQADKTDGKDAQVKFVTSYKCTNPELPECLWDMRYNPRRVDLENCRDMTKLYLEAVASFNRCVDRRSRQHAQRIVKIFNCAANKRDDCPSFYGED